MERFFRAVELKLVLANCFHNFVYLMIKFSKRKIKYRLKKKHFCFITFITLMASPSLRV